MTARLTAHLRRFIGAWPPVSGVQVVGSPHRTEPGWDGRVSPLRGLRDGSRTLVAVPPDAADQAARIIAGDPWDPDLAGPLGDLLGRPGAAYGHAVFRFSTMPAPLPSLGTWVSAADPRLPAWLRPFNGGVLAVFDARGAYLAGVGRKVHDPFGHEIAVGTTPAARGRGLARRLVATAARRILAEGAVPTYLHEADNVASARVADAAGFPDRDMRIIGLWGGARPDPD